MQWLPAMVSTQDIVALVRGYPGLKVGLHQASGALVVSAAICDDADPREALIAAGHLGAGAITLDERGYVLRFTVPAGRQDPETMRQAIDYVAGETVRLRAVLAPQVRDLMLFEQYA